MIPNLQNTSVIILAGGKSQRAETTKGLRKVEGKYWLDIQIDFFKSLGVEQVFVGLGFDHLEYITKSSKLSSCHYVINPHPENGPFSTLQCVLKHTLKVVQYKVLLIHIDHALPKSTTLDKLLENTTSDVVKPHYQNKSGHPIILSKNFCETLIHKPYSAQLNTEIQKIKLHQISWVEVDDQNIHHNFNTKDKWQNYKNTLK